MKLAIIKITKVLINPLLKSWWPLKVTLVNSEIIMETNMKIIKKITLLVIKNNLSSIHNNQHLNNSSFPIIAPTIMIDTIKKILPNLTFLKIKIKIKIKSIILSKPNILNYILKVLNLGIVLTTNLKETLFKWYLIEFIFFKKIKNKIKLNQSRYIKSIIIII
jgi:hypothetical protein